MRRETAFRRKATARAGSTASGCPMGISIARRINQRGIYYDTDLPVPPKPPRRAADNNSNKARQGRVLFMKIRFSYI